MSRLSSYRVSIMGLAVSLSLTISACGPAFQSKKGSKAGTALQKAQSTQLQNPQNQQELTREELARKAQEQIDQELSGLSDEEKAQRKQEAEERIARDQAVNTEISSNQEGQPAQEAASSETKAIEISDVANLFVSGIKLAYEGQDDSKQLVLSSALKRSSQDEKAQIELRAKIDLADKADQKAFVVSAEQLTLAAIGSAAALTDDEKKEYSLIVKPINADATALSIKIQRSNGDVEYAAEFSFEISKENSTITLKSSSLKENDKVKSFDDALAEASQTTPQESTGEVTQAADEASDESKQEQGAAEVAATEVAPEAVSEKAPAAGSVSETSKLKSQIQSQIIIVKKLRDELRVLVPEDKKKPSALRNAAARLDKATANYNKFKNYSAYGGAQLVNDIKAARKELTDARTAFDQAKAKVVNKTNELNREVKTLKKQTADLKKLKAAAK